MKITSFDGDSKIKRDSNQNNLFNLFQKNIVNRQDIDLYPYVVPREFEMRLDRISNFLYDTPDYMEEIMLINDIISPYSVKEGQVIYVCDKNTLRSLYVQDPMMLEEEIQKNTTGTVSNLKQILVTKDKVQIINTFE